MCVCTAPSVLSGTKVAAPAKRNTCATATLPLTHSKSTPGSFASTHRRIFVPRTVSQEWERPISPFASTMVSVRARSTTAKILRDASVQGFYGDHCEYLEAEEEEDDTYTFEGDYVIPDIEPPPPAVSKLILGLSAAVIVTVVAFIAVLLRSLFKGQSNAADIKNALSESESSAEVTNATGVVNNYSGDGSLEDIEVEDYVNDNTDTNVQIV